MHENAAHVARRVGPAFRHQRAIFCIVIYINIIYIYYLQKAAEFDFDRGVVALARGKFEYWMTEDGLTLLEMMKTNEN